jgi:hypothetical protein
MPAAAAHNDEPTRVTDTVLCGDYAQGQRARVTFRPEARCDFATGVRVPDVAASAGDYATGMRHTPTAVQATGDFATGLKRGETRRPGGRIERRGRWLIAIVLGTRD